MVAVTGRRYQDRRPILTWRGKRTSNTQINRFDQDLMSSSGIFESSDNEIPVDLVWRNIWVLALRLFS